MKEGSEDSIYTSYMKEHTKKGMESLPGVSLSVQPDFGPQIDNTEIPSHVTILENRSHQ